MNVHNMTQHQHVYSTYSTVPIPSYPNNEAMFNEKTNHLKNEVQDVAVPVVLRVLFVPSITVISDLTLCYLWRSPWT